MADLTVFFSSSVLVFVSLALGATLKLSDFKVAKEAKLAFVVGWTSQFVLMPAVAFMWAHVFDFSNEFIVGMILTGCSPGGTFSNLMAYWSKANLALSISMTVASNFMCLIVVPLLILIWLPPYTNADLKIPVQNVVVGLLFVIIPCAIGLWIRIKSPSAADKTASFGSAAGAVLLVVTLTYGIYQNPDLFKHNAWGWFCATTFQYIGTFMGYVLAMLFKFKPIICRTVAIETGLQNGILAMAIVQLSIKDEDIEEKTLAFPMMYALNVCVQCVIISWVLLRVAEWHKDVEEAEQLPMSDEEVGASSAIIDQQT